MTTVWCPARNYSLLHLLMQLCYPYITITRPITVEPESYQDVMGYPSYVDSTLGEMSGLCICDNIDLRTITGATDSEIDEIMSICKSGIHV